jgi:signal peptidase I
MKISDLIKKSSYTSKKPGRYKKYNFNEITITRHYNGEIVILIDNDIIILGSENDEVHF